MWCDRSSRAAREQGDKRAKAGDGDFVARQPNAPVHQAIRGVEGVAAAQGRAKDRGDALRVLGLALLALAILTMGFVANPVDAIAAKAPKYGPGKWVLCTKMRLRPGPLLIRIDRSKNKNGTWYCWTGKPK